MQLYCDGGCKSNGTQHAAAYGSFKIGGQVHRFELEATTNNQAEYATLLRALAYLKQIGMKHVEIHTDSALVVNQVAGAWKCKDPALSLLRQEAAQRLREVEAELKWTPRTVIVRELGH